MQFEGCPSFRNWPALQVKLPVMQRAQSITVQYQPILAIFTIYT